MTGEQRERLAAQLAPGIERQNLQRRAMREEDRAVLDADLAETLDGAHTDAVRRQPRPPGRSAARRHDAA